MSYSKQSKDYKKIRQRRTNKQLSKTMKPMKGRDAADHLGHKRKHEGHVVIQHDWMTKQKAAKLRVDPRDLDALGGPDEILEKLGFSADEPDFSELQNEEDAKKLLGRTGIVLSMAYAGEPGKRSWMDIEGDAWTSGIMKEKAMAARCRQRSNDC